MYSGEEIIKMLRRLADSMEAGNPDFELRDRLIRDLISWSVDNGHDSDSVLRDLGRLLA